MMKIMIKIPIVVIITIITALFRICLPPIILTWWSCPEAAFWPMNLVHLINFDEKTEQILK